MFKGFAKVQHFKGFPALNFQLNNEAYGYSGCNLWLDASSGLNTQTNLAAISIWKDKINGVEYMQNTAAAQPRLQSSDVSFNNYPTIDFNTTGRGLFATNGVAIRNTTLALVYQYISSATGASYNSRVVSDGDQTSARTNGGGFFWNRNNNGTILNQAGIYSGGSAPNATSINEYTTTQRISIININNWYSNGSIVTIDTGSLAGINGFILNAIGGSTAVFSGIFKVAEILNYNRILNSDEILALSGRLNSKYAIY